MGKNITILILISILVIIFVRSFILQPYVLDTIVTGAIEDIKVEEDFLFDDVSIVVVGESNNGGNIGTYEIPIGFFDRQTYVTGEKVRVEIYSNTDADVWDPDNMKFEIELLED